MNSNRVSRPLIIAIFFTIISLTLFPIQSFAQVPDTVWVRTFGPVGKNMAKDIEVVQDGIVVTGTKGLAYDQEPLPAMWLLKLDFDGNLIWEREFGDNHAQRGYSLAQTQDGGFIVSGSSWIDGVAFPYLVKTDSLGTLEWERVYDYDHEMFAREVECTPDGGYVITGGIQQHGYNQILQIDAYIMKTDSTGEVEWFQSFGGGIEADETWSIEVLEDGYAIAGRTWSTGSGMRDAVLGKTDLDGNILWYHTYGGIYKDHIYDFEALEGGGFIATGKTESFGNGGLMRGDIWLLRIDENGELIWDLYFGDIPTDFGRSVDVMDNGDFVVTGLTITDENQNQIFVGRASPDGEWIWTSDWGWHGMDDAWTIRELPDGDIVVGGYSRSIGEIFQSMVLIRITDN